MQLLNLVIDRQFGCSTVHALNINSIHERTLRIAYQCNKSTFQELLNKNNSFPIHHRNLQVLATEMFKTREDLCPEILREMFLFKTSSHDLWRNNAFERRQVGLSITRHWIVSVFKSNKNGDLVPLVQSQSLEYFKLKIKNLILFQCLRRFCKAYIKQVGFL